jgi:phosphonatase-like hydrolase
MKHRNKLVVLDMAGTTVDEDNVVYKTVHRSLQSHGVEHLSLDTVLEVGAGKEKLQAIKDLLVHLNLTQQIKAEEVFESFKKNLNQAYHELQVKPVEGTEKTLQLLKQKNIMVVLNTGYNSEIAGLLLNKLNWRQGDQYDALITADDVSNGRPHPEMILKAMEMFAINDPAEVLKAGDSAIDIEEGNNANCGVTIGVLSGAQKREQLESASPTYIMDSIATIPEILL